VVTIAGIEDAMAAALRANADVDFTDEQIVVSTSDDKKMHALLAAGGIAVMYAGSITSQEMVHGQRLRRVCTFIVSVGRKMSLGKRRLSQDIQSVVAAVTEQEWREDRFVRVSNGVGWHDIIFQATLVATP
jgi:phosphohistidine swiveling domain-containing protein